MIQRLRREWTIRALYGAIVADRHWVLGLAPEGIQAVSDQMNLKPL
jgi:hypothetical protein